MRTVLAGLSVGCLVVVFLLPLPVASAQSSKNHESIGDRFHEATVLTGRWKGSGDFEPEGAIEKKDTSEGMKSVRLPAPDYEGVLLEESLRRRRSVRWARRPGNQ